MEIAGRVKVEVVAVFQPNTRSNIKVVITKITESELSFFLFSFSFLFFFSIYFSFFHFSIFRTLGLGLEVIGHTVTSVTSDGVVTTSITGLEKRE